MSYTMLRLGFFPAGSSLPSIGDDRSQLVEWYAVVDGPGEDRGNKNQGGLVQIPARFKSRFEAIDVFYANIFEKVASSKEDVFSRALGYSEALAGCLKGYQDAKYVAHGYFSITEKKNDDLTESFPSLKDLFKKLLFGKGSRNVDGIASGVE